jgi:peptidoglycan/LPS O-acetylase OafA/YrhL
VLRFAAALAVIAFHLTFLLWNTPFHAAIAPVARSGKAGVDVFFVISGFIIFMVSTKLDWSQGALPVAFGFALRRAARIYPLYWLVFLVSTTLIITGAAQVVNNEWTLDHWTANALLLSSYNKQVPVAWTLAYELYFYACFSVALLFGPRFFLPALWLWVAASVIAIGQNYPLPRDGAGGDSWRTGIWANPLVLEFAMGMIVASLIARGYRRGAWLALLGSVPLFVLGDATAESIRAFTFGPAAALLVYGFVSLEIQNRLPNMRYVAWLGDASYSLYLWQAIPLYFTLLSFDQMGWRQVLGGFPAAFAMIAACILVSLLSYRFIEKPILAASYRQHMRALLIAPSAPNPRT